MLVDSHCHLDFPELTENLIKVLELMHSNEVACAACIGVNLEDLPRILSLAEAHSHLWATVGVHPEVTDGREPTITELVELHSTRKSSPSARPVWITTGRRISRSGSASAFVPTSERQLRPRSH